MKTYVVKQDDTITSPDTEVDITEVRSVDDLNKLLRPKVEKS